MPTKIYTLASGVSAAQCLNTAAAPTNLAMAAGRTSKNEDFYCGCRFSNVDIPAGAIITNAYVTGQANQVNTRPVTVPVAMPLKTGKWDGAGGFNSTNYPTGTSLVADMVDFGSQVSWVESTVWVVGNTYATADLTAILQEWVDGPSYVSGDVLGFWFRPNTNAADHLIQWKVVGAAYLPTLTVTYMDPALFFAPII